MPQAHYSPGPDRAHFAPMGAHCLDGRVTLGAYPRYGHIATIRKRLRNLGKIRTDTGKGSQNVAGRICALAARKRAPLRTRDE
jgi:hypothetical protein